MAFSVFLLLSNPECSLSETCAVNMLTQSSLSLLNFVYQLNNLTSVFSFFTPILSLELKTISAPLSSSVDLYLSDLSQFLHPISIQACELLSFPQHSAPNQWGCIFFHGDSAFQGEPSSPSPPVVSPLSLTFPSLDQPATLKQRLCRWHQTSESI